MISVILAGGSGTRLWPLSTSNFPKHLLSLNGEKSLVCLAYERAKLMTKHVYLVTDISHATELKKQIPDLPDSAFIIEPSRRGTAGCVVAALSLIYENHGAEEPIAFLSADHYIADEPGFISTFQKAEEVSKETGKIVLIGKEPYYPATGFGYIHTGAPLANHKEALKVLAFKEKPQHKIAKQYVDTGEYLWNCGYFVGSASSFLKRMEKNNPNLYKDFLRLKNSRDEKEFNEAYLGLKKESIDYALIEKVKDLLVIQATFDWMDLGSYTDLHKAFGGDQNGNHIKGSSIEIENVEGSFIHNEEEKPIAVIGLDNIVIVNTNNGLLVAHKDLSQQVGKISERFKNQDSK